MPLPKLKICSQITLVDWEPFKPIVQTSVGTLLSDIISNCLVIFRFHATRNYIYFTMFLNYLCYSSYWYGYILLSLQVLSRASDAEPYGWWYARLKMLKGEFAVVEYLGFDSTYSEIVPLERVRPFNRK